MGLKWLLVITPCLKQPETTDFEQNLCFFCNGDNNITVQATCAEMFCLVLVQCAVTVSDGRKEHPKGSLKSGDIERIAISNTPSTCAPQAYIFYLIQFSLYALSLDEVISSNVFSNHCYADDTQIDLFFLPETPMFLHGSQDVWQTSCHAWQLISFIPAKLSYCISQRTCPDVKTLWFPWTTLTSHHVSLHANLG